MTDVKIERRTVPADLVESTPGAGGLGYWLLASPIILFLVWLWIDVFAYYSPLPQWADRLLAAVIFVGLIVLPLGLLAYRLITALPRLFSHAGWDILPLEPVSEAEQYLVHYTFQARHRADGSFRRLWLRAAQGWVYIEIIAIFVGAIAMIPLFFSAVDFGFGQ
ncbi:MAG: hypothetical protein H6642_15770 [Caldilineaceae bacterium]|nr:hypothetical protein [Caldilineaceae bacterium]